MPAPENAAAAVTTAPTVTATRVTPMASLRRDRPCSGSVSASYSFSNGLVGSRTWTLTGSASLANRSPSEGLPTTKP